MDGPGIGVTYRQIWVTVYRQKVTVKKGKTVYRQKITVMLRYHRKSTVKIWFTVYRQKLTVNSHTV